MERGREKSVGEDGDGRGPRYTGYSLLSLRALRTVNRFEYTAFKYFNETTISNSDDSAFQSLDL